MNKLSSVFFFSQNKRYFLIPDLQYYWMEFKQIFSFVAAQDNLARGDFFFSSSFYLPNSFENFTGCVQHKLKKFRIVVSPFSIQNSFATLIPGEQ